MSNGCRCVARRYLRPASALLQPLTHTALTKPVDWLGKIARVPPTAVTQSITVAVLHVIATLDGPPDCG